MKVFRRLKPYKADTPINTINKIREILRDCNIFTIESHFRGKNLKFFSCRIEIEDEDLGNKIIGVNGKGMTLEYSLASAYAELMERIQNNFLFTLQRYASKNFISHKNVHFSYIKRLRKENLILDFDIAPDEEYFTPKEFLNSSFNIARHIFKKRNKAEILKYLEDVLNINKIVCVPFYNVKDKSICYIPKQYLDQVCISTGLCAGNTKQEAIIQGICEIFERYVIKKIYSEKLTPPSIPHEYFKNHDIYNEIRKIEELNNCAVIIKDCSLNIGLPVTGVLIIDRKDNRYTFKIGSDPSLVTSVERCFTEIFQGGDYQSILRNKFQDLNFYKEQTKESQQSEYLKTVLNGKGEWPYSIFLSIDSYPLCEFKHTISKSDEEDLEYIVRKTFILGFEIYIRDVSYLGFPSFQIYIPQMSELLEYSGMEFEIEHRFREKVKILFNIKNESKKNLEELALIVDKISDKNRDFDILKSFLNNSNEDFKYLNHEIFLMALFYRIDKLDSALKYINRYLESLDSEEKSENIYYYFIRDFLKMKRDNYNLKEINEVLSLIYGKEAKNFIEGLVNPKEIFEDFKFPSCFNCDKCEIMKDCKFFYFLKYAKILQKKYKKNIIDQFCLGEIFNGKVFPKSIYNK